MNVNTNTWAEEKTDVGHEASRFGLNIIIAMATLIGLWGTACLIGGLANNGVGGMLRGYLTELTGI